MKSRSLPRIERLYCVQGEQGTKIFGTRCNIRGDDTVGGVAEKTVQLGRDMKEVTIINE